MEKQQQKMKIVEAAKLKQCEPIFLEKGTSLKFFKHQHSGKLGSHHEKNPLLKNNSYNDFKKKSKDKQKLKT